MRDDDEVVINTREDAEKHVQIMLALGGSYSEIIDFLETHGVQNPPEIISDVVAEWSREDKQLSDNRRAIQRRRLMRQVRLAMDESRVGDAVRAEAILARLDDQEADAEAGKITNDFDAEMSSRTEEEVEFFVKNERWPGQDEINSKKEEKDDD